MFNFVVNWVHSLILYVYSRVESGSDDSDNLGYFLMDQVGLIRKLSYLIVIWISHVLQKTVLASVK